MVENYSLNLPPPYFVQILTVRSQRHTLSEATKDKVQDLLSCTGSILTQRTKDKNSTPCTRRKCNA